MAHAEMKLGSEDRNGRSFISSIVDTLDDWGLPAWIGVMVLGFIVFWPVGLGILAYLIWSGRMGCGRSGERWSKHMGARWEKKRDSWERRMRGYPSSGNRAFDEYREHTLKRLEEEQKEFRSFLERLRMARDREEFERFMNERRDTPADPGNVDPGNQGPAPQPQG